MKAEFHYVEKVYLHQPRVSEGDKPHQRNLWLLNFFYIDLVFWFVLVMLGFGPGNALIENLRYLDYNLMVPRLAWKKNMHISSGDDYYHLNYLAIWVIYISLLTHIHGVSSSYEHFEIIIPEFCSLRRISICLGKCQLKVSI